MAKCRVSRRAFLKTGAAGAAAVAVGARTARAEAGAWSTGMAINPDIDNLRVVSYYDTGMVNQNAPINNFSDMTVQNNAANTAPIQANLDQMAKALAAEADIGTAWRKIFRRPSGKTWSQVNVAIKVNCIGEDHSRLAIVDKICRVLNAINPGATDANDRSVPFANIIIYDGCHNAANFYPSFVGTRLPAGVQVSNGNSLLGGTVSTAVPGMGNYDCSRNISNGTIDLLVNISVNKSHDGNLGGLTLTMKNHYGTFTPGGDPHYNATSYSYLTGINKSDAIVGGSPVRQQLCIVDALWASAGGCCCAPSGTSYRLVMGTFAPAVDFLTGKKVREVAPLNYTHSSNLNQFLVSFGYTTTQRDNLLTLTPGPLTPGPGWVNLTTPVGARQAARGASGTGRSFMVHATSARGTTASVEFALPEHVQEPRVAITDLQGHVVRELTGRGAAVLWDGRTGSGSAVAAGKYVVRIAAGDYRDAKMLVVGR